MGHARVKKVFPVRTFRIRALRQLSVPSLMISMVAHENPDQGVKMGCFACSRI